MIMKTKPPHQNKFLKIITLPIRALAKARDFYVRSMNNYADKVYYGPYGASGWTGTSYVDAFPRSVSTSSVRDRSSESDDYKELVRAASTSTLGNRVDLGSILPNSSTRKTGTSSTPSLSQSPSSLQLLQQQKGNNNNNNNSNMFKGVPRSASVGMAKIEEDKPITEFGEIEDNNNNGSASITKKKSRFFPRSRSYAVAVSS